MDMVAPSPGALKVMAYSSSDTKAKSLRVMLVVFVLSLLLVIVIAKEPPLASVFRILPEMSVVLLPSMLQEPPERVRL